MRIITATTTPRLNINDDDYLVGAEVKYTTTTPFIINESHSAFEYWDDDEDDHEYAYYYVDEDENIIEYDTRKSSSHNNNGIITDDERLLLLLLRLLYPALTITNCQTSIPKA